MKPSPNPNRDSITPSERIQAILRQASLTSKHRDTASHLCYVGAWGPGRAGFGNLIYLPLEKLDHSLTQDATVQPPWPCCILFRIERPPKLFMTSCPYETMNGTDVSHKEAPRRVVGCEIYHSGPKNTKSLTPQNPDTPDANLKHNDCEHTEWPSNSQYQISLVHRNCTHSELTSTSWQFARAADFKSATFLQPGTPLKKANAELRIKLISSFLVSAEN